MQASCIDLVMIVGRCLEDGEGWPSFDRTAMDFVGPLPWTKARKEMFWSYELCIAC